MSYDAKPDSVKTPAYIKKWIRKKFCRFNDPVPFNPKFDPSKHTDALKTEWKAVNFINPPFSRASTFIKKAVEEFQALSFTMVVMAEGINHLQHQSNLTNL